MRGINEDGLIRADGYADTMEDAALPYIAARRKDALISGKDGRPLFVSRFDADAPTGTVMIVHGFTENADKFAELIHSLLRNDLSVLAYDQRGHGRSWRQEGLSDVSLTHVERFEDYVYDMGVIRDEALSGMPKPHRLFCHSMGGAVTGLYLEGHAGAFDRVVMCAPMIAPNLGGMPRAVARLLCGVNRALGRGRRRIFVSKPYQYPDDFATAPANGRERFDWYEAQRRDRAVFRNNSPTYGWTLESIDVTDKLLAPGAPERIDAKVRLYTAALDDTVLPEPQAAFIARVKGGERVVVEGAKHEIYRSPDDVLFPWWHEVLDFLKT